MEDLQIAATRAIHDALSLRGPAAGRGGMLRTAPPAAYMGDKRHELAREVLAALPANADAVPIKQLIEMVSPIVARYLPLLPEPIKAAVRGFPF